MVSFMKKRFFVLSILVSAFLGLGALLGATRVNKANADALPFPYVSFTNNIVGEVVAIKGNSAVSVDISTHRFLAITLQVAPGKSANWAVYSLSLIDNSNNEVVSLDISDARKATIQANEYPTGSGLVASDFTGTTGGRRVVSNRVNLPTSKSGYFAAQKSNAYSTIEYGFNGTIFYHLPDYTDSNISNIYGLKIVNKDSASLQTVNIFNAYFCEAVQKSSGTGYSYSGLKQDFDIPNISIISGSPTINGATDITSGHGLRCVSGGTSEIMVSFQDQVNVSLDTYKYLALNLTIDSPDSSKYLNIAPKIYDKTKTITNNLLMDYTKAQAAKANEYPEGLAQSDWSAATGGCRINLPNETYTRISCLTSEGGLYVPIKADNSYNFVFKGGLTYTTYIYLPDFGIDNFNLNSLSLTCTGASDFTINEVYLCQRVVRVAEFDKTTRHYYPAGNKLVLPIISAYSNSATLTDISTVPTLSKTYYYIDIDNSLPQDAINYLIYEDEGGNLKVDATANAASGYEIDNVKLNGVNMSESGGVYSASLTQNSVISAEIVQQYSAEIKELGTKSVTKMMFNSNVAVNRTDYLVLDIEFLTSQNDTYAYIGVALIDENNHEIGLLAHSGYTPASNPSNSLEMPDGTNRVAGDRINNPTSYGAVYAAPNKVVGDTSYLVLKPDIDIGGGVKEKFSGTIYMWLGDFLSSNINISGIAFYGHSGENPKTCSYKMNGVSFANEAVSVVNEVDLKVSSVSVRNGLLTDTRMTLKSTNETGETFVDWISDTSVRVYYRADDGSIVRASKVNNVGVSLDSNNSYLIESFTSLNIEGLYSNCEINTTDDSHGVIVASVEESNLIISVDIDNGYKVSSLTLDGNPISLDSNGQYTCPLNKDVDVVLTCAECTVNETVNSHGTVTHVIYDSTKVVEYTITPDPGYGISSITLNGENVSLSSLEDNVLTIETYNQDLNLVVTFEQYVVNVDPAIAHGHITSVIEGGTVTLTAVPDTGYYVNDVIVNDVSVVLDAKNSITLPFDRILNVSASFTAYVADASYITSQGNVTIDYSDDHSKVNYHIEAKFGYRVESITLNGENVGAVDGVVTTDNDKNNDLNVIFVELITIDDIQNGIIEYLLDEVSQTVTFKVTAADGYVLESFIINGEAISLHDGTYSTTLTGDMFVSATFNQINPEPEIEPKPEPEKDNNKYLPFTIVAASIGGLSIAGAIILIVFKKKRV